MDRAGPAPNNGVLIGPLGESISVDGVCLTVDAAVKRPRGERFICTYRDPIRVGDLVQRIARNVIRDALMGVGDTGREFVHQIDDAHRAGGGAPPRHSRPGL